MSLPAPKPRFSWEIPALLAAIGVCYLPIWRNGFYSDDLLFIVQNKALGHVFPLSRFFLDRETLSADSAMNHLAYRPLAVLAFALINALVGIAPRTLHGLNLLLHAVNSLLVLRLASRLSPKRHPEAAFFAALIFALHPVQVEAVAWAVHLSTLASATFLLAGLNLAADRPEDVPAILACNLLSVLFKESGVVFPALAALVLIGRGEGDRRTWRRRAFRPAVVGGIVIAAVFVPFRAWVLGAFSQEPAWAGPGRIFMLMVKCFAYYVKLALLPYPLSQSYLFKIPRAPWEPLVAASSAVLLAVGASAWLLRRKHSFAALGVAWFFLALAPVSGVFTVSSAMNERFLYIPIIGFALIVGNLAALSSIDRRVSRAFLALVLAAYGLIDFQRLADWRDQPAAIAATLRTCPQDQLVRGAHANELRGQGRLQEAAIEYLRAIAADPDGHAGAIAAGLLTPDEDRALGLQSYPDVHYRNYARLYCELGTTFRGLGQKTRTIAALQECLRRDSNYPMVYRNLGVAYFESGDPARAVEYFQAHLRKYPQDGEVQAALAHLMAQRR